MNLYEEFYIVPISSKIKIVSSGLFGQNMVMEWDGKTEVLSVYILYMKVLLYCYNDGMLTTKAFVLYF